MKKKLVVIGLMLVLMLTVLAACGAPGYVANPPKDIDDYVEKLEDNGWEVYKSGNMVNAVKTDYDEDEMEDMDEDDKVSFEQLTATYWDLDGIEDYLDDDVLDDLLKAIKNAVNKVMPDVQEEIENAFKDNDCKATVTLKANDYALVLYMKVSGTIADISAAMRDASQAMNDMEDEMQEALMDAMEDIMKDLDLEDLF